jgi:hypothetical protein
MANMQLSFSAQVYFGTIYIILSLQSKRNCYPMQFFYPYESTNKISPNLKLRQVFILPCALEDHDMFLETKLDDGNISLIGRVLEIKAHELVLLPSFVKPILEIGKKTRHLSVVVRVHDIEIGAAMCTHLPVASDRWCRIHGGEGIGWGWKKKRGRGRGRGREMLRLL